MKKPRILIAIHYMELGGAEISLVGLLQSLDYERVDVDLFVYRHQGELMRFIPSQVNLLPEIEAYACIEAPMAEALRRRQIGVLLGRLAGKMRHCRYIRACGKPQFDDASVFMYAMLGVAPFLPDINPAVEYDLAISFLTPHNIVRDKVRARHKVAWIHTDYSRISVNVKQELPVWCAFDNIVSISPDVTVAFVKTFPTLANRIVEIENILSPVFVRTRALEFDVQSEFKSLEGGGNYLNHSAL